MVQHPHRISWHDALSRLLRAPCFTPKAMTVQKPAHRAHATRARRDSFPQLCGVGAVAGRVVRTSDNAGKVGAQRPPSACHAPLERAQGRVLRRGLFMLQGLPPHPPSSAREARASAWLLAEAVGAVAADHSRASRPSRGPSPRQTRRAHVAARRRAACPPPARPPQAMGSAAAWAVRRRARRRSTRPRRSRGSQGQGRLRASTRIGPGRRAGGGSAAIRAQSERNQGAIRAHSERTRGRVEANQAQSGSLPPQSPSPQSRSSQ